MKGLLLKVSAFVGLTVLMVAGLVVGAEPLGSPAVFAESKDGDGGSLQGSAPQADAELIATSISISPVSKILQLEENSVYEDAFTITNNGRSAIKFEVYAAPYSYTYSEADDTYTLGFSTENAFTKLSHWVTFQNPDGEYATTAIYDAEPGQGVEVHYRISTPEEVPSGGQYAVLFARTISGNENPEGIRTEASPGLVVYGRSSGEAIVSANISQMSINRSAMVGGESKNLISASAKVKNNGNIDFTAVGKLVVTGLFGNTYYETPSNQGRVSIIPEVELSVTDAWDETPFFGLFHVAWTVSIPSDPDNVETMTQLVVIMPTILIILFILLLTMGVIWIIIVIRKRKERRSKFRV